MRLIIPLLFIIGLPLALYFLYSLISTQQAGVMESKRSLKKRVKELERRVGRQDIVLRMVDDMATSTYTVNHGDILAANIIQTIRREIT